MTRVVEVSVAVQDAPCLLHLLEQTSARIGGEDVKRRRLDPAADGPLYRPVEHGRVVAIETEDEAGVDHHTEAVEPVDGRCVVAPRVVPLPLSEQVVVAGGLEPYEEAPEACVDSALDEARGEDGRHCSRRLEDPLHPPHTVEERRGMTRVGEDVVVEEVEMPSGKPVDLGESPVHRLHIVAPTARVERMLVAEVARVGTATGNYERVGYEVAAAVEEIAAHTRNTLEAVLERTVDGLGRAPPEILEEAGPGVLAWPEEHVVRVKCRLCGTRRWVQPAHGHAHASTPVCVSDPIGAFCRCDVDLQGHEIGLVVVGMIEDVLVHDLNLVLGCQVPRQRR